MENLIRPEGETTALDNRLSPRSRELSMLIQSLKEQRTDSALRFEQTLVGIAEHILREQSNHKKLAQNLPGIKSSTREEIFHRLNYAVDFIYSTYEQDVTLDQLARISCLSNKGI